MSQGNTLDRHRRRRNDRPRGSNPAPTAQPRRRREGGPLTAHQQAVRQQMHVHMARYLGFACTEGLAWWEWRIVDRHLMLLVREFLSKPGAHRPDPRGLVEFIDLERSAAARLAMIEAGLAEEAMACDMAGWDAWDYYRHVIVGIVADDMYAARHRPPLAVLSSRGWTFEETARKLINFLALLVQPWQHGPGAGYERHQCALVFR